MRKAVLNCFVCGLILTAFAGTLGFAQVKKCQSNCGNVVSYSTKKEVEDYHVYSCSCEDEYVYCEWYGTAYITYEWKYDDNCTGIGTKVCLGITKKVDTRVEVYTTTCPVGPDGCHCTLQEKLGAWTEKSSDHCNCQ